MENQIDSLQEEYNKTFDKNVLNQLIKQLEIEADLHPGFAITAEQAASLGKIVVKPDFTQIKSHINMKNFNTVKTQISKFSKSEVEKLKNGEVLIIVGEKISIEDIIVEEKLPQFMIDHMKENKIVYLKDCVEIDGEKEEVLLLLDTHLTPELIKEGLAREFISVIQEFRKKMGLRPEDKINLWFESSDKMVWSAMHKFVNRIKEDLMINEFHYDDGKTMWANKEINGRSVQFYLEPIGGWKL